MSEYLVNIKNERLSFFTPAGEEKAKCWGLLVNPVPVSL